MKIYDASTGWGTHVIEVTFQHKDYKGTLRYEVDGNAKGATHIEGAGDHIAWTSSFVYNNCGFKAEDDYFHMVLTNKEGDKYHIEDDLYELDKFIVEVRIVSFKEDKTDD